MTSYSVPSTAGHLVNPQHLMKINYLYLNKYFIHRVQNLKSL